MMPSRVGRYGAVHLGRVSEPEDVPGPLSVTAPPPCPYCGAIEGEPHEPGCRRGPDAPVLAAPEGPRVRRDLYGRGDR